MIGCSVLQRFVEIQGQLIHLILDHLWIHSWISRHLLFISDLDNGITHTWSVLVPCTILSHICPIWCRGAVAHELRTSWTAPYGGEQGEGTHGYDGCVQPWLGVSHKYQHHEDVTRNNSCE